MTAIIQFFTSHFFGNMVYGIINNLITFIFVWFIHAFIPYKPKYQSRKNLTRATLLLYIGLVIISYLREVPGNNAIPIFYLLMALYFVFQLVYLFTVFDGSIAMRLLLFFVEKIIEILGMALGDILAIWLIPDYMYYYLLDNVRGVWYFNASIAASEPDRRGALLGDHPADTVCAEPQCPLGHLGVYPDPRFAVYSVFYYPGAVRQ